MNEPPDSSSELPAAPEVGAVASIGGAVELGGPRLSALGKCIEMLRVERGLSKQVLARSAGTSRQQLWRVMTGKSELTTTLCARLASVLDVDSRSLSSAMLEQRSALPPAVGFAERPGAPASLGEYLASPANLARTLRSLPAGEDGVTLKCALLNAVEERARAARIGIPAWLLRLRGSVLDGSL